MDTRSALAAIRFGTGLSPRLAPPDGPEAILAALSQPDSPRDQLSEASWETAVADAIAWIHLRRARREGEAAQETFRKHNRTLIDRWFRDLARVLHRMAHTQDGMRERLALFWADHFTVAGQRGYLRRSIPAYEADLRAAITGRFGDLLRLAVTHPAMIEYLDQRRSIGPNSPRGRRGGGMNENLAREVLELHTLGADGPYTQTDVTELAQLMTGLTITKQGLQHFAWNRAEPGPEAVLGQVYGGAEEDLSHLLAALDDIAVHPATAAHVSRKLAIHFIADNPPADLVDHMMTAWLASEGDLMAVYAAMLEHPAAWAPELRKVRRPIEVIGASLRALDTRFTPEAVSRRDMRDLVYTPMRLMGQNWHLANGPDGWPEAAEDWITPQLLAARIEWAMTAPAALSELPEPRGFLDSALGPFASGRTRFAVQAAETREAGVGLALAAAEFQRR